MLGCVEVEASGHDHCPCPSSEALWQWPGGLGTSRIYRQENTFQDVPWRQLTHAGVPPWARGRADEESSSVHGVDQTQ